MGAGRRYSTARWEMKDFFAHGTAGNSFASLLLATKSHEEDTVWYRQVLYTQKAAAEEQDCSLSWRVTLPHSQSSSLQAQPEKWPGKVWSESCIPGIPSKT